MHKTNNNYKLIFTFLNGKHAYYTFATMYHSNAFPFFQIYPYLLQFT